MGLVSGITKILIRHTLLQIVIAHWIGHYLICSKAGAFHIFYLSIRAGCWAFVVLDKAIAGSGGIYGLYLAIPFSLPFMRSKSTIRTFINVNFPICFSSGASLSQWLRHSAHLPAFRIGISCTLWNILLPLLIHQSSLFQPRCLLFNLWNSALRPWILGLNFVIILKTTLKISLLISLILLISQNLNL